MTRPSGDGLKFPYPYITEEMALAKYVVLNANHKPGSGTSQMMIMIRPRLFMIYAKVITHAC